MQGQLALGKQESEIIYRGSTVSDDQSISFDDLARDNRLQSIRFIIIALGWTTEEREMRRVGNISLAGTPSTRRRGDTYVNCRMSFPDNLMTAPSGAKLP